MNLDKVWPKGGLVAVLAFFVLPLLSATAPAATDLEDVWCTSSAACIAVGASDESGRSNVHAKRWNGTAWIAEEVTVPSEADSSRLKGVTCLSASACTAVGSVVDDENVRYGLAMKWNGSAWLPAATPTPTGAISSELRDIACTEASACVAVGSYLTETEESQVEKAMVVRWNGSEWSLISHPQPSETLNELEGISCVSTTNCVAVGSFVNGSNVTKTLASVWNGTSWSIASTPEPSGAELTQLQDVSCRPSEACTAVGSYSSAGEEKNLALRRSAAGEWTIQSTPNQSAALSQGLTAVWCSAATTCAAVGVVEWKAKEAPVAMGWNGTSWSSQTIDAEALGAAAVNLTSISCVSATVCNATGAVTYGRSAAPRNLAFTFNGSAWLVTEQGTYERSWRTFNAMRRVSQLASISCPTDAKCLAVGHFIDHAGANRPQVGAWVGGTWTFDAGPMPSTAEVGSFTGVSCPSPTVCWAVGAFSDTAQVQDVLLSKWNGTSWSLESAPSPEGAKAAVLSAVDCSSGSACIAVGSYIDAEEVHRPLALELDGGSWSLTNLPQSGGAVRAALASVSCPSSMQCVAVGLRQDAFGHEEGLALEWNGTSWSTMATPNLAGEPPSALRGVTCPATQVCLAVGGYEDSDGTRRSLGLRWDGATWTNAGVPADQPSDLAGISCPSASSCVAVGQPGGTGDQPSKIIRWDGASWSSDPPIDFLGASEVSLTSVACRPNGVCNAIGASSTVGVASTSAMLSFDGESWTSADATTPGVRLRGVSCPAPESCLAVGDAAEPLDSAAAAWTLDDEDWIASTASTASNAYLSDVSCAENTFCVTVGREGSWPFKPLASHWNGQEWTSFPMTPPSGRSVSLESVSCPTSTWCASAGFSWASAGPGPTSMSIETWNGASWQLASPPAPSGAVSPYLLDVSCTSATFCTAVGSYTGSNSEGYGLVERWNGSNWTASSISPPAGQSYRLKSVDCTSASACTAVGVSIGTANGERAPFAARWNGSSWTVESVPQPDDVSGTHLDAVDCYSPIRCIAVGSTSDPLAASPVVIAWHGGAWEIEATSESIGSAVLDSVSCPAAGDCIAVGYSRMPGRPAEPLMVQAEGEHVEEPTDPVVGASEPSPELTAEQKDEAIEVLEEDAEVQAALGAAEASYEVGPWTETDEEGNEALVGAYVEVTLDKADTWPEREWSVTSYSHGAGGYEGGEYTKATIMASAEAIDLLGISLDLTFDAGENVIEGEAVQVLPLALESGDLDVTESYEETHPEEAGY